MPLWTSHETVKLTDSVASVAAPSNLSPIDHLKHQLEALVKQTDAQESALLRYHAELTRQQEENYFLKIRIIEKNHAKLKYKFFRLWCSLRTAHGVLTPKRNFPQVMDSVNMNDTLRNLALSLQSPQRGENSLMLSTSSIKSVNVPFQTVRRVVRPHGSNAS